MFSGFKSISRGASLFPIRNVNSSTSFVSKINIHNLNLNKADRNKTTHDLKKLTPDEQNLSSKKENHYYIENGLRKVYPYYYEHSTYCKGRWFKRKLIDVYLEEFLYPKDHMEKRILEGDLQVNGNRISLDYELKDGDCMTSYTHRHELPVLATPIKILFEDDKVLVVDKPPSIPVHPCGLYRYNSLVFLLAEEQKRNNIFLTHRLDRLTSGVLILAKDSLKSRELHDETLSRNVQKEYLCRVEGNFPDGEVVCDKPLKQFYKKIGVSIVHSDGKPSRTEFQKLSFNGKSSVVLCQPKTGRTHQIRVHLQYLGYPIVNDPLYNCYAFGPNKGKHGDLQKSYKDLLSDLVIKHSSSWWIVNIDSNAAPKPYTNYAMNVDESLKQELYAKQDISPSDLYSSMNYGVINENTEYIDYRKNPERITFEKNCYFCTKTFRDPKPSNLVMFLHAFKYKGDKWEFTTEIPRWAESDWNII